MSDVMLRTDDGSRTDRRRSRARRRAAFRMFVFLTVASLVAGGAYLVAKREPGTPAPVVGEESEGGQVTLLVATTVHDDPSGQADSLTLFGVDRSGADPVTLFIPTGTFGQIPGQSSIEQIGKALSFGTAAVQRTTVENLLGIVIDRTAVISDVALAQMIESLGGVTVDVTEELYETGPSGRSEPVFTLGETLMSGPEAVTYLTYRGEDETELDRFVRAQKVWEAILVAGADAGALVRAMDGASELDDADARALGQVLGALAAASADDRTFDVLPVDTVGSGGLDDVYSVDADELAQVIGRSFAASLPPGVVDPGSRTKIEIRNGVGSPQIGAEVAALLVPAGFKVEVTGNIPAFGIRSTQIVVYGDDEPSMALGNRVRELLGVGTVIRGTRGQTVVDMTIVVGKDFTDRKG
jgi:LCP family protein required for cell wall assembly